MGVSVAFVCPKQNICSTRATVYILTQYCAGGKIEKNEMGVACGAYGEGERRAQGSSGET